MSAALATTSLRAAALEPEPANRQQDSNRVLSIALAGPPEELLSIRAILGDGLAGLRVTADVRIVPRIEPSSAVLARPSSPPGALLGYALVDLSDDTRATVYIVDGPRERILVRHIPRTTNAEILHETIGRIVMTGVEALLSGSFGDLSKPAPARALDMGEIPPVQITSLPPSLPTVASRVGVFYEGSLYSSQATLTHGPGIAGAISFGRDRLRLGLWLTAQYRFPLFANEPPLGLRLDTTAVRALVGVELDLGSTWTFEAGIGLGLDLEHVEPRLFATSDAAIASSQRWAVVGIARALLGMRWKWAAHVSFAASLVLDVDPSGSRFTRDGDADADPVVIAPYPLRPGISCGMFIL